ncbi:flagellar basal body P-ring formation chaperone FlgA [Phreatobacter oligotrophus]|jgi:flagellar basal body P-ring formation protein FlgA|uniref:flagellar basal body P-ring formation chaperone FlgA n=1 Tax=Phreatobacter oligotrophus TaxID=1122261 RepID=UPI0023555B3D|nr:flagellar basal body P-ring formation chaperone FlgA [Phreatobacter oligotrophus]MBX9993028.1 flagellar basal body P-ring formation chaperone FlgA [Phreatobacter oligotrophus]
MRTLRTLLASFALGLAAAPVAAFDTPPRPVLRLEVAVSGEVVRLGDLFQNAGRFADVPVFRSPDPGHTGQVPAWRIIEAARRVGLEPETGDRNREVSITRDARILPLAEMEERIAMALASSMGLSDSNRVQVAFDRGTRPIAVEKGVSGSLDILRMEHDPRTGRFEAVLGIGGSPRTDRNGGFRVQGTAVELVEFVVLARSIGRGEVIRSSDLVVDRKPRTQVPALTLDTVVSATQAVGMAARRPIGPERPFRMADLMKPELVERNGNVLITMEMPGLSLTMRGRALEAGAEGDMIQVENLQSRKRLQATVTGLNRVSITPPVTTTTAVATARTP